MPESDSNNRIDYIELHVADVQRSKAFYGTALGWSTPGGPLVILYANDLAAVYGVPARRWSRLAHASAGLVLLLRELSVHKFAEAFYDSDTALCMSRLDVYSPLQSQK